MMSAMKILAVMMAMCAVTAHAADEPARPGVLVRVGRSQVRAGLCHPFRTGTVSLGARCLCAAGLSTGRFPARGMCIDGGGTAWALAPGR